MDKYDGETTVGIPPNIARAAWPSIKARYDELRPRIGRMTPEESNEYGALEDWRDWYLSWEADAG